MTDKGMFEDAALIKKLQASIKDEKERRQFAENELALIKGVGNNSPEMKTAKKTKSTKRKPVPKKSTSAAKHNIIAKTKRSKRTWGKYS